MFHPRRGLSWVVPFHGLDNDTSAAKHQSVNPPGDDKGKLEEQFIGVLPSSREDVDPREVVEIGAIDTKTYRINISASATDLSWWIDADDLVDMGLIQKTG